MVPSLSQVVNDKTDTVSIEMAAVDNCSHANTPSPSRNGCIPSDFLREPSNSSNVVGVSLLSEHLKGLPVLASNPVTLLIHSFKAAVYMSLTKARIRLNSKQQQDGPYQQRITHRYNELQHCRNATLRYVTLRYTVIYSVTLRPG